MTSINPVSPVGVANESQLASVIRDHIVGWTLRRKQAAASFSGAVQLLLLAHTPVSRKVFQWFHCNDISGRRFLRADVSLFVIVWLFGCLVKNSLRLTFFAFSALFAHLHLVSHCVQ